MTLDDPEGPPPLEPPPTNPYASEEPISIPPIPIDPFFSREAVTEPTPPIDADAVANLVIAALAPRLDGLRLRLDAVAEMVVDLRGWRHEVDPKLAAIDRGVGSALNTVTNAAAQVERLADAIIGLTDIQTTLAKELAIHREHTIDAYDRLGARVIKLEDWKRESGAGEDDGSLTAIAISGRPPAE